MRILYLSIFFIVSLLTNTNGQWKSLGGPEGGIIQSLENDGTKLYAGTTEGHLLIGDGTSWETLYQFPNDIFAIFKDGNYLWVGTSETTWFLELDQDGGIIEKGEIDWLSTWSFVRSSDTLYMATSSGIYYVKDGNSMLDAQPSNMGLPSLGLGTTGIAQFDNKLYTTALGFNDDFEDARGIYVSSDAGQTWESELLVDNGNRFVFVDGNMLYAGTFTGLYYKHIDATEWEIATGMGEFNGSTDMVKYGDQLFVATFNGLYVSEDGKTFEQYSGVDLAEYILFMDVYNNQLYFGGYGIYKSEDAENWQKVNEGMISSGILTFCTDTDELFVGTSNNGIFSYSDATWTEKNTGIENALLVHSIVKKGETLFASTGQGVRKSTDNGSTWTSAHGDLEEFIVPQILIVHNDLLLAMSGGLGIYVSDNDGETWVQTNDGLTCGRGGCELYNLYKGETGAYVLAGYGVFKFDESTMSWIDLTQGALPPSPKWSILEDGEKLIVTTQEFGIFYTEDDGENWNEFPLDGIEGFFLAGSNLIKGYGDYYFMIGVNYVEETDLFSTKVYYTPIDVINWKPIMDDFPEITTPMALAVKGNFIYAGTTTQGVWRLNSQIITSSGNQIHKTEIAQNYPNPFTSTTTIRYQASGKNELVILDARGVMVNKLVGQLIGNNLYEATIDMSSMPASIYYYYSQSEKGLSETKKMILVK